MPPPSLWFLLCDHHCLLNVLYFIDPNIYIFRRGVIKNEWQRLSCFYTVNETEMQLAFYMSCVISLSAVNHFFFSFRALRHASLKLLWCSSCWLCSFWGLSGWHRRLLTTMQPVWSHSMVRFLKEICHLLIIYGENIQFNVSQVNYDAASFG